MSELTQFVHDALAAGRTRTDIACALTSAGWRKDEAGRALAAFADVDFPIPVPRRSPQLSARDAFLHLLAFFTLYISAIGAGTLLFMFANLVLPDKLNQSDWRLTEVHQMLRFGAAALIICFPVYLCVTRGLNREYARDAERRSSPVRKWLTYLTLFAAAGMALGYLIAGLMEVLGGELAANFALKVGVVLAIAGAIFGYYVPGLSQEERRGFDDADQLN